MLSVGDNMATVGSRWLVELGDNERLRVSATDADVRFSYEDDDPAEGCPSSHNFSLTLDQATFLAHGLLESVEKVNE